MMINRLMVAAVFGLAISLITMIGLAQQVQPGAAEPKRFDELVRADFFAGLGGDAAAMARAMRLIEQTLSTNPRHPEALVWHGSALVGQGALAFEKGDAVTGANLFERGLQEMNDAVTLTPDNVGVLIPRGATLLEVSRSVLDRERATELLATGVRDYEKALALQAPYFRYLSEHSRGELLFGLAEGLHRLGERERARRYFERLLSEAKNSTYGTMAAAWLDDPSDASVRRQACVGCHRK